MKKNIIILLLICSLTLCLAACDGGKNDNDKTLPPEAIANTKDGGENDDDKTLSPEAIANTRDTLDTMSLTLGAQKFTLEIYLSTYELEKIAEDPGAVISYANACNEYEEILAHMKEIIDYCRKDSSCFSKETHASIDALEKIYNDTLSNSKSTSKNNEKAYVQIMKDLKNSISDWNYVSTAE